MIQSTMVPWFPAIPTKGVETQLPRHGRSQIRSAGAKIDDSPQQRRLRIGRTTKKQEASQSFNCFCSAGLLIDSVHANLLREKGRWLPTWETSKYT